MQSSRPPSYSLPSSTEQQHYVAIAPELTARVGTTSSENSTIILSDNTNNDIQIWKNQAVRKPSIPPIRTNPCGEPFMNKRNYLYNSDLGVQNETRIDLSGSIAPPIPARVLFSDESGAYTLPNFIFGSQARAIASPPGVGSSYHCATQQRADGTTRAQIGIDGYIPRWIKGATVTYVILEESFKTPDLACSTAAMVTKAIAMWKGIGVKLKQVPGNCPATFQIKYRDLPFDNRRDIYAEAFFPQDGPGTLFVYKLVLQASNRCYLANILAHEIGHILGLRHSFAGDFCKETGKTKESGSVLWGARNESSVMNYFTDLKRYSVQEQDLEELRSFYNFTGETYKGLMVRDFEPCEFPFNFERQGHKRVVSM
ncbi:hypothetical protein F4679DRAFT_529261 [Xylaria curta]|nr:hypothetical protein F4679DRAFT_529261 [Xylaria curta]